LALRVILPVQRRRLLYTLILIGKARGAALKPAGTITIVEEQSKMNFQILVQHRSFLERQLKLRYLDFSSSTICSFAILFFSAIASCVILCQ
jgi:hypothetical protein